MFPPSPSLPIAAGDYYAVEIRNKSISVIGVGDDPVIIDCNGTSRAFRVQHSCVRFDRIAIRNCNAHRGAAISIFSPDCRDVSIKNGMNGQAVLELLSDKVHM